jgi:hypothetical protein
MWINVFKAGRSAIQTRRRKSAFSVSVQQATTSGSQFII